MGIPCAHEKLNGRLAMVGFVAALATELDGRELAAQHWPLEALSRTTTFAVHGGSHDQSNTSLTQHKQQPTAQAPLAPHHLGNHGEAVRHR